MMKKKLCLLIACCMVLTMGACVNKPDPTETTAAASTSEPTQATTLPPGEPTTEPAVETDPVYNDSLLSELQMDAAHPDHPEISVTFRVPQILDDTPDAQALNDIFASRIRDYEAGNHWFRSIEWKHYWNGPLLSIVLEQLHFTTDDIFYDAFTYDFSQGMLLENEDLLSILELDFPDMHWMLRHAVESYYDNMPIQTLESLGAGADMLTSRAETLTYRNLDLDSMPLYLDQIGQLHAIADIGYPVASGVTRQDLALEPMPQDTSMTAEGKDVQASIRDNQIYVVFETAEEGNIERHQEYRVSGAAGVYQDMKIVPLGPDEDQYLCLLNDNGKVTVCNLTKGAAYGGSFIGMPLLRPFEPVEKMETDGYAKLVLVTESGKRIDAYEEIAAAVDAMSTVTWSNTWVRDVEEGVNEVTIGKNDEGLRQCTFGGGGGMLAGGRMVYAGMDEYGLHFRFKGDPGLGDEGLYLVTLDEPLRPTNPDDCLLRLYEVEGSGFLKNENPAEFYQIP